MAIDMTNAQRQSAYRARRAAAGVVQVQVFVHRSRREAIRLLAAGMQEARPTRRRGLNSR